MVMTLAVMPKAWASDWVYCCDSKNGKYYIDSESIQRDAGSVRYWVKNTYSPSAQEDSFSEFGQRTVESKNLWEVNCGNRTGALITRNLYDAQGNLDTGSPKFPKFTPIIPDSISDFQYKMLCPEPPSDRPT